MSSSPAPAAAHRFPIITDWDKAYSNRLAVADFAEWMEATAAAAERFHRDFSGVAEIDVAYGRHSRETFDLYHPEGPARGTLVLIHGGYWRAQRKEGYRHFASGPLAQGWRVALPEYPLCPEVAITDIVRSVTKAVETIVDRLPEGPIILSGHSAGGHLATHLASARSALSDAARARLPRIVSLAGLHDLRPFLRTTDLNGDLRLQAAEAAALSPALDRPGHDFELVCVCGGDELPEFRRQNALLANIWNGLGIATEAHELPRRNHFTLLDPLCDADSELTRIVTQGQ